MMDDMSGELREYFRLREERPGEFAVGELDIITDLREIREFEAKTGHRIGVVYKSRWNIMVVDLVRDAGGRVFPYERLLPAVPVGAVVMLPFFEGRIILLRQFRHALRGEQLALPRGFAEEGLSVEENAEKELGEELGAQVKSVKKLGEVVADSGLCGNRVAVCLCELNSYKVSSGHEGIGDALPVTPGEMNRLVADNSINDGYTLSAWAMYKSNG